MANLVANDFQLLDAGVPQTIDVLTLESVPLDVTLFVDTSGSTAGALDRMKGSVRRIAAMMRPEDRIRVLTIGLSVETAVPWHLGPDLFALDIKSVAGISLIYDALFVALSHTPEAGRRHFVVALTDGRDCGSVLDGPRLLEMSGRTEAVMHWVDVRAQADFPQGGVGAWCSPLDGGDVDYVGQAVKRSGGATHYSTFGDPAVKTFAAILNDFRQSYVLRYSPKGVKTGGWHPVRVTTPRQSGVSITARAGYLGAGVQ